MKTTVGAALVVAISLLSGIARAEDAEPAASSPALAKPAAGATPAPSNSAAQSPPSKPADQAATGANDRRPPGVNALLKAAADPEISRLRAALRQGADVNARAAHGETALQSAATAGLGANVFTLLTNGADIDMVAGRGITALGWAARGGHESVVRMLLDSGAQPDRAASPDRSPIALAAAREHYAIVALLIDRGSKVFEDVALAGAVIGAIAQTTSIELAGLVVPRLAPLIPDAPALRDQTAFAIAGSSVPVSSAILSRLGEVGRTTEFQTALLYAAVRRGRYDVASAAIAGGANMNARRGQATPLGIAVELADADMITLLVTSGADTKGAGVDQEKLATLSGSGVEERKEVDRLARLGDIDRLDDQGMTLLFRASQRGNFLSVKQLLDHGANPSTTVQRWPGDAGWTPLMIASAGNQIPIVKLLLASGAASDQRNAAGRTALMFAALYGRSSVVDMLVAAGADPRATDSTGLTPMLLANESGDSATILRMQLTLRATEEAAAAARDASAVAPGAAEGTAP